MARLPAYPTLLNLGKERPNAILLDLGCCCESASHAAYREIRVLTNLNVNTTFDIVGRLHSCSRE